VTHITIGCGGIIENTIFEKSEKVKNISKDWNKIFL